MPNVIDSIPDEFRAVVTEVLREQNPQLLDSLQNSEKPSLHEQELLTEILADEFDKNYGPGHIPTERGVLIDNALGAFLVRWPQEDLK